MKRRKKKGKRLKNRWGKLIYLLFLIGSTILVSFRGGNISYLLFYFALLLPVLAFLYSLYVFNRFKIVQEVSRVVVKAQEVPYRLLLANEDILPFTHIRLHFFSDMVRMKPEDTGVISLLPHEEIRVDTKMYCKYRGNLSGWCEKRGNNGFPRPFHHSLPDDVTDPPDGQTTYYSNGAAENRPAGTGSQNIPVSGIPPSGSARL